jgi:hypothetical protein
MVETSVDSIASGLAEFADAATLKKDGRRLSLEGVLTGSALGVLLLYLMEEGLAATGQRPRGGPLDDPGVEGPGGLRAKAGSIAIRPLDGIDVGMPLRRAQPFGSGSEPRQAQGTGSGRGIPGAAEASPLPLSTPAFGRPFAGSLNAGSPLPGGARGPQPDGSPQIPEPAPPSGNDPVGPTPPEAPGPVPPPLGPVPPTPVPVPPPLGPDPQPPGSGAPQLVVVLVRTFGSSSSRTVEGKAESVQVATQVGIENTLLDLRVAAGSPGLRVESDRTLQSFALSQLDDADLRLVAEHIGLLNSTVLNGEGSDVLILNARDLLQLGVFSPTQATVMLQSELTGMQDSSIQGQPGEDAVALEGLTTLTFTGLGGSERAHLSFDLLTTALRNSGIFLGEGDDTITINSGYLVTNQNGFTSRQPNGLSFDLGDTPVSAEDGSNWVFSLNARAVGLENSLLDLGGGNDRVSILTMIDADLRNDLGVLYDDPFTSIKLERVGLLNSEVRMGSGDDQLRINGAVIDSIIDLGSGSNTLWLEDEVSGSSRILMGDGNNTIFVNGALGGKVQGGAGDDRFSLSALDLAGELDGGEGFNTLEATAVERRQVLVMSGANRGNLDGLRFENIQSVDLGSGNDVALMDFNASLTGALLGGSGLDRLEYNNWTLPVFVDLDRGAATGIAGGRSGFLQGFEQVVGGLGSDTLISSGAFDAIDGGEGDDLLILRWSPWLSSDGVGLQVRGGGGSDLVVFSGLEQQIPAFWDGQSGLPDLVDLDLSPTLAGGIGLSDRIGWLRTEPIAGGDFQESLLELSPSGLDGIGDARLLPIAPLEQLLVGMESDTRQLAIAWDGQFGSQLHLLGSQGIGTSQVLANLPSALNTAGFNLSGSSGSTP